jgi:hypothetical protein
MGRNAHLLAVCKHQIVPQECPYCELARLRTQLATQCNPNQQETDIMVEPVVVTCNLCDGTGVVTANRQIGTDRLVDDLSGAMEFVREIARAECLINAADCACIVCRANAWLHSSS